MRLEAALEHPDDDPRGVLTDGLASADRLERTIEELLLLAGEAERMRGEQVDLQALVQEIGAEWTPRFAAHDRVLECRVTQPLPTPRLSTAAARQILTVLLDNAEAHGAGTVRIEVRESTDAVAVDVSDEGAGPAPESGPFDRRPGPDGHGIGLGLARRIAEAEGGRLVLTRPAPPVFTLLVLADWSDGPSVDASAPESSPQSSSGCKASVKSPDTGSTPARRSR
jgi:signal transduction histidine kinase